MAYSKTKASARAKLANPKAALQSDVKASGTKQSTQEQFTGRGTRTIKSTSGGAGRRYSDTDREIGTRVQMAPNAKGTADLKDPLGSYRVRLYPAIKNPDPQTRRGLDKAPGRRSPTTAPNA